MRSYKLHKYPPYTISGKDFSVKLSVIKHNPLPCQTNQPLLSKFSHGLTFSRRKPLLIQCREHLTTTLIMLISVIYMEDTRRTDASDVTPDNMFHSPRTRYNYSFIGFFYCLGLPLQTQAIFYLLLVCTLHTSLAHPILTCHAMYSRYRPAKRQS